jgi:hypothetical protein
MSSRRRPQACVLPAVALALLTAACTPSKDCRYADWACAPGFQCVQAEGGAWDCAPASPVTRPGMKLPSPGLLSPSRPPEALGAPKPLPLKAPGPCTGRPPCRKDALECTCDGQDRLLTTVFDANKDGQKDECATYSYPSATQVLVEVDQGCDGSVDVLHVHELDAAGNEIAWTSKPQAHPEKSLFRRFLYQGGKLAATETAMGAPEKVIQRCDYQPPCPPPIPNSSCKPVCRKVGPNSKPTTVPGGD